MKSQSDHFSVMLQPLIIKRLASAPGVSKFLMDKITVLKPGEAASRAR